MKESQKRSILAVFLPVMLFLAMALGCQGQSNVYYVAAYTGGTSHEHDWTIGSHQNVYGLTQFSQWQNTSRHVIINTGKEATMGGVRRTFILVQLGPIQFRIRATAMTVAVIGSLTVIGMLLCGVAVVEQFIRRHHNCRIAAN